jgi:uncharacterized protein YjgD (DUF1641 family)
MAQPIPLQLAPRDPKRELVAKLEQAPAEHAAALLDGYELLQELHEQGAFTLVRGVLGAKDKIVDDLAARANSVDSIRAIRNAIILGKMLGSIDPDFLQGIALSVGETFGSLKEVPAKPPGLFSLLFGFTGADHRRGLALWMRLFKRIGCRLNSNNIVTKGGTSTGGPCA